MLHQSSKYVKTKKKKTEVSLFYLILIHLLYILPKYAVFILVITVLTILLSIDTSSVKKVVRKNTIFVFVVSFGPDVKHTWT